jgi:hypothetical protein
VKHLLIAGTIIVATAAWATPSGATQSGRCFAKESKINGQMAIVNCGPATATIRYKGKTYKFKSGDCLTTGGAITVDLGTNFVGDDNHGYAHFSLTMISASFAPVLATSGKLVINGNAKLSSRGAKGTFTGTTTIVHGGKISEAPLSGSWNCGAVYKF